MSHVERGGDPPAEPARPRLAGGGQEPSSAEAAQRLRLTQEAVQEAVRCLLAINGQPREVREELRRLLGSMPSGELARLGLMIDIMRDERIQFEVTKNVYPVDPRSVDALDLPKSLRLRLQRFGVFAVADLEDVLASDRKLPGVGPRKRTILAQSLGRHQA